MKAFDTDLFRRILGYAKPYRKLFVGVIVWAVLLSLFVAARPYLLKYTVNEYIEKKLPEGFLFLVSMMGVVLVLEVIAQFYFVFWANKLGQDIVRDMRVSMFNHMMKFRMKYYDRSPVGQLVTRTVSDLESISRIFGQGLFMIISDLMKMTTVILIMFYMNWKLSLIVVSAMPILVYATRIFQIKMKGAFEEVRTQIANLNTFVQERLTGMKIVQLFSREDIEFQKFSDINQKHKKAWIKTVWYNSIFFPVADIITYVTLGLIVWYGGFSILDGDTFTTKGDILAFIMFISMLFNPLRQIADKFNELQMGMISARRVFDIIDIQDQVQKDGTELVSKMSGQIGFKNVTFGYNEDEMVLKNISFEIRPGETVAIVGSTGAGKSTIINLINRFYEVNQGTIEIDGKDIRNFKLESLRKHIAVVLQDVFLFADTIYNNITLNNYEISREQVILAAKKIGVHNFIESLPQGYDYNVKERGVMLSSGQRQLIAFLRAYVSNPEILVLDEATSSVDTYTEELIQKATEKITKGRTSIIIAHRLATIVSANRIFVMDKGQIVEIGTHQELLSGTSGFYKQLYEAQFAVEKSET
jgi:ABC-type multidrug transport system fused ATPase/permease subunit